ncbi:MAG: Processing alpha glucosidase I [Bogoriella megaspora]|nr:MAG: Processing alpha glucosidase I [Bogoriella megaspora]
MYRPVGGTLLFNLKEEVISDMFRLPLDLRHTCEQHEGMAGYGWDEYDIRNGGRQTIHDAGNFLDVTTEFVKVPEGNHGGNWGVRIKGIPRDDAPPALKTAVFFYAGTDGLGQLEATDDEEEVGYEGAVAFNGETADLGKFKIDITKGLESNNHPQSSHPAYKEKPLDRTFVHSLQVPPEATWQSKPLAFASMKTTIDAYVEQYSEERLPPPSQVYTIQHSPGPGNMHFVQKVFEGAFEFDVLYSAADASRAMTSESVTNRITAAAQSFKERFAQVLNPRPPFSKTEFDTFSKSLFSNLLGGIGYFYGDALIDRSYASEYDEENEGFWEETEEARSRNEQKLEGPYELFTSIPSRPFFPRGFLWDEGFHLLPILDWDVDLTLEIIKSWFNLMDEDGWIGREQILGPEARTKVPVEFQVQYPHYANPPTLFFVLDAFLDKVKSAQQIRSEDQKPIKNQDYSAHLDNEDAAGLYLKSLYPLLKRHYYWYRKTQSGDIKSYDRKAFSNKEAYRWRGRTPRHILTSGLDDYPRPQPPHPGELHTDLISWMGMMTRVMKRIAETAGETEDAKTYASIENAIIRNIDDLHWDDEVQTYCDATIDDYEEDVHVCHKGYISLFPFMTGLVASDSPRLGAILDLIGDPEELWSDHGVRSLSKKDEFYGTDENYWRSPVWMNMNYLIVKELLNVASKTGQHQARAKKLYSQLRLNLVQTVYKSWQETGFAWEQYNPETGEGQRTQHFTGWTSLVVKIMNMPSLDGKGGHDEL